MIKAPVMRYHGSKFRLAPWVISHFPPHDCYVESFGGAAGILMQKPRSYAEVYNDLDGEVVNVFRVLRDPELREQLIEACYLTPFARADFELDYDKSANQVERARQTLFRAEAGFGSGGSTGKCTGFRNDSKRAYSLAAHIWSKYPERIAAFGERLQGVIIENRPAIDVMKANDSETTLHYIDPPYVMSTRNSSAVYRHEMTDKEHEELLATILNLKGHVVLSGYSTDLYEDSLSSWHKHAQKSRISSGRGTGIRTECLWIKPHDEQSLQGSLI